MKNLITIASLSLFSIGASAGTIYTAYNGSQNGVTIRDSTTLAQSFYFNPGFVVDNIAAGANSDMYLTSGNNIYRYSDTGAQLSSFTFPDPAINYQGISYAGSDIYTAYTGSQNGVTVRDSTTLAQSFYFNPGFAVDNVAAGANSDMYLTSGNNIYRYSDTGVQLSSFTFPDPAINYQGITFAFAGSDIYTAYTGSQNGVTIRDATTLAQSFFFDPGFAVDNLVAGDNNDMFLTSGNNIYQYSIAGVQLNSFAFPDSGIIYKDIAFSPSVVPIPAAVWLFGSGLIGLVGLASAHPETSNTLKTIKINQ